MTESFPKHEALRERGYARFKEGTSDSAYANFDLSATYRIFHIEEGAFGPIAWIGPTNATVEEINEFESLDARVPRPNPDGTYDKPRAVALSALEGVRPPISEAKKD